MALTQNNNGDTGLLSRTNINAGFTQIDTNAALISNNQIKGIAFGAISTDVSSSILTYADIGLTLNYTPKNVSAKILVDFRALLYRANTQTGVVCELNYSVDNGSSYSQKEIFANARDTATGAITENISGMVSIDVPASPATPVQCIFKINFKVVTNAVTATLKGVTQDTILRVEEIA